MVTLVIMDGFGLSKKKYGNAIKLQGTPFLKKLEKEYPYTEINASGEFVGLSSGVMGNSEVGHLNLGAGRVVYQDLTRINKEIREAVETQPAFADPIARFKRDRIKKVRELELKYRAYTTKQGIALTQELLHNLSFYKDK